MDRRRQVNRSRIASIRQLPQYGTEPTRVLAAGNGQRFIEKVSAAVSSEARVSLLGGAQGRVEAAERLVLLKPDVVVVDINLDYELGGIDTSFALRRISPSTAFVLVSPFSDPERLAMVPRGLGLDWSYVIVRDDEDFASLSAAVSSAAWSIPYIDSRIDRSRLGGLQSSADEAVNIVLSMPKRRVRGKSKLGYAGSGDWNGNLQWFKLPEDGADDEEGRA